MALYRDGFKSYLKTGRFSDVTLVVGSNRFAFFESDKICLNTLKGIMPIDLY